MAMYVEMARLLVAFLFTVEMIGISNELNCLDEGHHSICARQLDSAG